jgi:glycosyltransferase involved in cell wall biosynthesis
MWDKMAVAIKALNRVTIGLDDSLLVVSEAARHSKPRSLRRRAVVVIHGIEIEPVRAVVAQRDMLRKEVRSELGLRDGNLLALTVANLRREKGYDILLEAARSLADREVPVTLVAVGRGPYRDELITQHANLELAERFRFLGQRSDVLRLLAASDIFVLPSRQEGLPVALMEATNVGVPMVVSAVGELLVLLTDGVDALLVPPEDPGALADAIDRLAADVDLRTRLAAGAASRGALFDVARCVHEVEGIYDGLCPWPHRVPQ